VRRAEGSQRGAPSHDDSLSLLTSSLPYSIPFFFLLLPYLTSPRQRRWRRQDPSPRFGNFARAIGAIWRERLQWRATNDFIVSASVGGWIRFRESTRTPGGGRFVFLFLGRMLRKNFVNDDGNWRELRGMSININNDLRRVDRYIYTCVSVHRIMQRKKIAYARRTSNSYEPVVSAGGTLTSPILPTVFSTTWTSTSIHGWNNFTPESIVGFIVSIPGGNADQANITNNLIFKNFFKYGLKTVVFKMY